MKTPNSIPDTCSTTEAARLLGISVRAAQLWVENGMLEAWKTPGGHRRILRSSINQILDTRHDSDSTHDDRRLAILIIEGSQAEREALGEVLRELFPECKVQLSQNAFESLLSLGDETPDVVIADIDGLDLAALGAHQGNRPRGGTLLIALASNPAAIADQSRHLPGEFVLLGKPPARDEMQGLIRAFRQGRQNHRRKA